VKYSPSDTSITVFLGIRAWSQDREGGAVQEPEVKAFLLGNGGVGKTQLCRFLIGQRYDPEVPTTHGVQLAALPAGTEPVITSVRLNIWDFGGQDIYHGTHALFL
jgi:internalin A